MSYHIVRVEIEISIVYCVLCYPWSCRLVRDLPTAMANRAHSVVALLPSLPPRCATWAPAMVAVSEWDGSARLYLHMFLGFRPSDVLLSPFDHGLDASDRSACALAFVNPIWRTFCVANFTLYGPRDAY